MSSFRSVLFFILVLCSNGCAALRGGPPPTPQPIVPPIVQWDASYAEPMGTPATATVRRGIVKIVLQFPDEGENPKWIKALLEYKDAQQDGALARMTVFSDVPGVYTLQLIGAALAPRQLVHIAWLTQNEQRGNYEILIEQGVMRPTPQLPTNNLARP